MSTLDPQAYLKLREMVRKNTNSVIQDQRRCENLLKDYFANNREAEVLATAVRQRVAADLIERPINLSGVYFAKHLQRRLQEDCGLELSAAEWAVNMWAAALGADLESSVDTPKIPLVEPLGESETPDSYPNYVAAQYHVRRESLVFGPYSLSDLQRYSHEGYISPHDMVRSEAGTEWIPISRLPGTMAVDMHDQLASADAAKGLPKWQWSVVLIVTIFTFGLFMRIYGLFQADWVQRVDRQTNSVLLMWLQLALLAVAAVCQTTSFETAASLFEVASFVCYGAACLNIRSTMQEYFNRTQNANLRLNAVESFLFGSIYLQFHFNRLRKPIVA